MYTDVLLNQHIAADDGDDIGGDIDLDTQWIAQLSTEPTEPPLPPITPPLPPITPPLPPITPPIPTTTPPIPTTTPPTSTTTPPTSITPAPPPPITAPIAVVEPIPPLMVSGSGLFQDENGELSSILCEVSLPDYITVLFVYISSDASIEKVVSERIELQPGLDGHATIPYGRVLQLIQTKKTTPAAHYQLLEILGYAVYVDDVEHYIMDEGYPASMLHHYSAYDAIVIKNTMRLFHNINALYFLFKEKRRIPPKSILKRSVGVSEASSNPIPKKTKRNDIRQHTQTKRVAFV